MTKVLVATEKPFAPAAVDGIRQACEKVGFELALLEKYTDKAELLKAVADADGLVSNSSLSLLNFLIFDLKKNSIRLIVFNAKLL